MHSKITHSQGTKTALLRWTISAASREFDLDRKTLTNNLTQAGALPGPDGRYRTLDIVAAVFGDVRGQRQRLIRAQADRTELQNEQTRATLIPAEAARRLHEGIFAALTKTIEQSNLEGLEKREMVKEMRCAI